MRKINYFTIMSNNKFCPECGTEIENNERFCQNCGTEIPSTEQETETPVIGAGARANIMGGLNKTTNTHNNVNTSNVDNSSTVNHNTTYVMNEKKVEYCEVCGNALEEKHARCPKCGKEICGECKVKGKNRCIECEKKAIDEYRTAFQQLYLSSKGDIRFTERDIMDSMARRLDLEGCKDQIENELIAKLKPALKPVQPEVAPIATAAGLAAHAAAATKNIGTKDMNFSENQKTMQPKQTSGNKTWLIAILVLIVIVIGFFALSKDDEKKQNEQEQTVQTPQNVVEPTYTPTATPKQAEEPKVVIEQKQEPAKPQTDTHYEAGMKAYEAGEGLEAINHFNKSGSAKAYYMLGLIYENGCGNVGKNAMLARKNFKKAANLGSTEAKSKL